MNRRSLLLSSIVLLGLGPLAALADVEDAMVRRLRAEGYADILTGRTWLGRVQISAIGARGRREIVLNPITGEVLRDIITTPKGDTVPSSLANDDGNGNSGHGSGGDDGSDDDGGDDDHSGDGGDGDGGGDDGGDDD